MTLSVYIPALGQQDVLDECVDLLVENQELPTTKIHVIDNGSQKPITSSHAFIIRNEENRGMVGTLRQAREHCTAEILVYLHSDMFIFHEGWDREIATAFENDPKLGLLGVVGAEWATKDGGRAMVHCAFRDWVSHGHKPTQMITPVALLDGCFMAFRKSMMEELDLPDLSFPTHHFYDKSTSVDVIFGGYRVGVINLDSEHLSGQTSCRPEYQDWAKKKHGGDEEIYLNAERRYLEKYGEALPIKVDRNWNYITSAGPVFNAGRPWFS